MDTVQLKNEDTQIEDLTVSEDSSFEVKGGDGEAGAGHQHQQFQFHEESRLGVMNDTNEQKHDNEHDSMSDLEVTDEQAEQARAGDGSGFQSEYKYVPVRTFPE